jgi:hypothetical protein
MRVCSKRLFESSRYPEALANSVPSSRGGLAELLEASDKGRRNGIGSHVVRLALQGE